MSHFIVLSVPGCTHHPLACLHGYLFEESTQMNNLESCHIVGTGSVRSLILGT